MEPVCDNCRTRRAIVYCKADSARLCLECDWTTHSTDGFSLMHPRSLLCNNCISQPAFVRCLDEDSCFCQGCVCVGNCLKLCHQLQTFRSNFGCPSMDEFTSMWTQDLDSSASYFVDPNCELLCNSFPLDENFNPGFGIEVDGGAFGLALTPDSGPWTESSPMPLQNLDYIPNTRDQQVPLFSEHFDMPKGCLGSEDLETENDGEFWEGLNVQDVQINFMNGDEIFGCTQSYTECQQGETGTDSVLMKSLITESSCAAETPTEASSSSSSGYRDSKALGASLFSDTHTLLSSDGQEANLGFFVGEAPWNVSLSQSNLSGETGTTVHHLCGSSPALLANDSLPWELNLEGGHNRQAREEAKKRYFAKKEKRVFSKQIRYASRKARADTRRREKGRFVKAGEAYDYDPVRPTT